MGCSTGKTIFSTCTWNLTSTRKRFSQSGVTFYMANWFYHSICKTFSKMQILSAPWIRTNLNLEKQKQTYVCFRFSKFETFEIHKILRNFRNAYYIFQIGYSMRITEFNFIFYHPILLNNDVNSKMLFTSPAKRFFGKDGILMGNP